MRFFNVCKSIKVSLLKVLYFNLWLYPCGDCEEAKDYISCFLASKNQVNLDAVAYIFAYLLF